MGWEGSVAVAAGREQGSERSCFGLDRGELHLGARESFPSGSPLSTRKVQKSKTGIPLGTREGMSERRERAAGSVSASRNARMSAFSPLLMLIPGDDRVEVGEDDINLDRVGHESGLQPGIDVPCRVGLILALASM